MGIVKFDRNNRRLIVGRKLNKQDGVIRAHVPNIPQSVDFNDDSTIVDTVCGAVIYTHRDEKDDIMSILCQICLYGVIQEQDKRIQELEIMQQKQNKRIQKLELIRRTDDD